MKGAGGGMLGKDAKLVQDPSPRTHINTHANKECKHAPKKT